MSDGEVREENENESSPAISEKKEEDEQEKKNGNESKKTSNKDEKSKSKKEEDSGKRKSKRTVSGPKMTGSLHMKGFKRPLNQKKLKKTLQTYGEVKHFWMSRNKQEGLVTFLDERDAYKCKNAMQNSFYPSDLPRHLAGKLHFTETDEATVQFTCEKGTKKNRGVSRLLMKALVESTSDLPRRRKDKRKRDSNMDEPAPSVKKAKRHVKSSKVNKLQERQELAHRKVAQLFQKTKAKPSIYWKKLTDEEIAKREEKARQQAEQEKNEHRSMISGRRGAGFDRNRGERRRSPPRRSPMPRRDMNRGRRDMRDRRRSPPMRGRGRSRDRRDRRR